jgi:hypothetical protein
MLGRSLRHIGNKVTLSGIEYTSTSIPDNVTLYPNYIEKSDCYEILNQMSNVKTIVECIKKEIQHSLNLTNNKVVKTELVEVTSKKGFPLSTNYTPIICILNIGRPGPITFKNNKTNKKYIFTLDNGMLLVMKDVNKEYSLNIPYMSLNMDEPYTEDDKRYVLIYNIV